MAKQLVNVKNPSTGKRKVGVLDTDTGRVNLGNGQNYSHDYLRNTDGEGGVGYFETRSKGKIVQKKGRFKK